MAVTQERVILLDTQVKFIVYILPSPPFRCVTNKLDFHVMIFHHSI